MAKKGKCVCPEPGLTAPFYMLTYGDMMTLLLTFFVLLFSMSTLQIIKFQAQIGAMRGALGISKSFSHSPMQQHMPAPSVKESPRVIARSSVKPTTLQPLAEYARIDLTEPVQHEENRKVRLVKALGSEGDFEISQQQDDIVLTLPTFGVFSKGSHHINANSPEVSRVAKNYAVLANQIKKLTDYDIEFIGHTDSLPIVPQPGGDQASDNMELGFLRATSLYNHFFKEHLKDTTRITFGSQGDNIPVIPNATLDSERRQNRRVEIRLRKRRDL